MPWKCPQCGVTGADDKHVCEACGFVEIGPLALVAAETGKEGKFNINTAVGRSLLRTFAGDEARFASEPQFDLQRDPTLAGWTIRTAEKVTNPTFYNGAELTSAPVKLEEGGTITIGPTRMKLTVRLNPT